MKLKPIPLMMTAGVAVVVLFGGLPAMAGSLFPDPGPGTQSMATDFGKAYQDCILVNEEEIRRLRADLGWLELKISKIKAMQRPVPPELNRSVAFKKERLKLLSVEKNYYTCQVNAISQEILPAAMPPEKTALPSETAATPVLETLGSRISKKLSALDLSDSFRLIETGKEVELRSKKPIYFSSGNTAVAASYNAFLDKVAKLVRDGRGRIVVNGFTDKVPIHTKRFPSNFELGAMRAANVVHALIKRKVSPGLFKIASTGEHRFPEARPMAGDRARERYVSLTITYSGS